MDEHQLDNENRDSRYLIQGKRETSYYNDSWLVYFVDNAFTFKPV